MSNNTSNLTLLSEHGRVSKSRHVLAILNFVAVLIGTIITMTLLKKRGCSNLMMIMVYLMVGVNAVQLALCITDCVLKRMFGIYVKYLPIITAVVAVLWLGVLGGEVYAGTQELGETRMDLLVVFAIQAVVALTAYLVWPMLDRRSIDVMTHGKVRENSGLRLKKAKGFVGLYVAFCMLIIVAQAGVLLAYKMPPKIYDLFEESRAVKYTLTEDSEGYIVSSVYRGTSNYLNIPATYNEKPVVGIAKGALVEDEVFDKYKVKTITFGTPTVNENGEEVIESNIKYIESGAIVNNQIESLLIPASVETIGEGAIASDSLLTLTYDCKANFSYSCFETSALQKIVMEGDEVGKIVSLDGMSKDVLIEVDKDIYNEYREENFEYVTSFKPILDNGEFCIDFFTGCDYYIESIFCAAGESINLAYTDLVNKEVGGAGLKIDTLAYIKNPTEVDNNGAKEKSAFRGWYYDSEFKTECAFTENGTVNFTTNTKLYAKWLDEYEGIMDWGTYEPAGATKRFVWTDEDVVTFPAPTDRVGYKGGVQWRIDGAGEVLTTSKNVSKDVTLKGEWILDKPVIDIDPTSYCVSASTYVQSPDKNSIEFTYDENSKVRLDATEQHDLVGTTYAYKWKGSGVPSNASTYDFIEVNEVPDTDTYELTVTAVSPTGETSTQTTEIRVNIFKKNLDLGSVALNNYSESASLIYNAAVRQAEVVDRDSINSNNVAIRYVYTKDGIDCTLPGGGVKDAGEYRVTAIFYKSNDSEFANYNTDEKSADFVIKPKQLENPVWSTDTFVYNAYERSVAVEVDGVCSGDHVNFEYKNNLATNAGDYRAQVLSIDNPNYSIDNIRGQLTHDWSITKKEVTVNRWVRNDTQNSLNVTYDGTSHNVKAVISGVCSGDDVNFTYEGTTSATNAKTYDVNISGLSGSDSQNYYVSSSNMANKEWTINKKTLTVNFVVNEPSPSFTYNGNAQGVYAEVSGFVAGDAAKVTADAFAYDGSTTTGVADTDINAGTKRINFYETNVSGYKAVISGVKDIAGSPINNYDLSSTEEMFSISQKALTVTITSNNLIYNAADQYITVDIGGIVSSDIDDFSHTDFVCTLNSEDQTPLEGEKIGYNYRLSFTGRDAGTYEIGISGVNNHSNYALSAWNDDTEIAKKELTVNWEILDNSDNGKESSNRVIYNGTSGYSAKAVAVGVQGNDVINLSISGGSATNAGNYTTTASLPSNYTNYKMASNAALSKTWYIDPKPIDFEWKISRGSTFSPVYDGNTWEITPTFIGICSSDEGNGISVTFASGANKTLAKDYGTYTATINGISDPNYTLSGAQNLSKTWNIQKATVTLRWTDDVTAKTYTAGYQGPSFELLGEIYDTGLSISASCVRPNSSTSRKYISIVSGASYSFSNVDFAKDANDSVYKITDLKIYNGTSSSAEEDTNYTLVYEDFSFKINKAKLTLNNTWKLDSVSGERNVTYSRTSHTVTTEVESGLLGGETVTIYYSNNVQTNAGTYTATVTGVSSSNYYLDTTYIYNWTIDKKEVTLVWVDKTYTYTGRQQSHNVSSISGVISNDSVHAVYLDNSNVQTDANTYTTTVTGVDNDNYVLAGSAIKTHEWEITPYVINSLDWSWTSAVYNGTKQYPTATHYFSNTGTTVTISEYTKDNDSTNVDTYTITAKTTNSNNFVLKDGAISKTYSITQKPVSISWDVPSNLTYDGTAKTVTATVTGVNGEPISFRYDGDNHVQTNAKTYTVSVGVNNANYTVEGAANVSKTFTISPRSVTVSWSGAGTITYDGNPHEITATVSGVSGDVIGFSYSGGNEFTNAATNYAKIGSIDNSNYTLSGVSNLTSPALIIKPRPVSIDWTDEYVNGGSVPYERKAYKLMAKVVGVNGESVDFDYFSGYSFTNAGTHYAEVYTLNNANYTLDGATGLKTKSITITPKKISLTWNNASVTYSGSSYSVSATANGIYSGDTVKVDCYPTSMTEAGTHNLSANLSGANSANYEIDSTKNSTFTIKPQPVKISWSGAGTYTYKGSNYTLTGTAKNSAGTITVATISLSKKDVGNYVLTMKNTDITNSNYTLDGASGGTSATLRIIAKELTLTWSNSVFTYNGNKQYPTATVSGVISGDDAKLFYHINSFNATYAESSSAGEYTITPYADNTNYTIADGYKEGITYTIKKQAVTIEWSGEGTYEFDGSKHVLIAVIKGVDDGRTIKTVREEYRNAGTYTRTIIESDFSDNYTLENTTSATSATVIINPKSVTLRYVAPTNLEVDGSEKWFTVDVYGVEGNDEVWVRYQLKKDGANVDRAIYAGHYTVEFLALQGDDVGNYTYNVDFYGAVIGSFELVGSTPGTDMFA